MTPVEPDWSLLLGGDTTEPWIEDIARKVDLITPIVRYIVATRQFLESVDGSNLDWTQVMPVGQDINGLSAPQFILAHPIVLLRRPQSIKWYVSLAGIAQKTMTNLSDHFRELGGTLTPSTLVGNLSMGRAVGSEDLALLCLWLNTFIVKSIEPLNISTDEVVLRISMIMGGRIVGQGQNIGGSKAVDLLKKCLVMCMPFKEELSQIRIRGKWEVFSEEGFERKLGSITDLKLMNGTEISFKGGGNNPDIIARSRSGVFLVGEVKGRKDLSTQWESWMPQIKSHLEAWGTEFPNAKKFVFGTLFVQGMIDGVSIRGNPQPGLKQLQRSGLMDGVFNLTNLQGNSAYQRMFCREMMDAFGLEQP
ncbi:MAG: hypothetical protein PHU23_01270 [Dehalococcoidales bacterium]|nr:hypothetical protein [Dehalococcoidales bacterium]